MPPGSFTIRPDTKMPDGFDPRVRPWYKGAESSSTSTLTEPYIDAATGQTDHFHRHRLEKGRPKRRRGGRRLEPANR